MVYDVTSYGAVCDGNPSRAAANTSAFQNAINAAVADPAPIYVPMGKGFVVSNGQLKLPAANMKFCGESGMGSVPEWGATSTIIGKGPGHTLTVTQGGCQVYGLAFQGSGQQGNDCFLKVTETQVDIHDLFMDSPNVGISIEHNSNSFIGQSWMRNVLMTGVIKTAGIDINAGGGAVRLEHVLMFNGTMQPNDPQPPYGILVRSAGELVIRACDIDNCGTNLAIVPGMDGTPNTYVNAISVSDSYFDNGNGDQVLVRPTGSSFVLTARFSNVWTSSVNNNGGAWPGNGFTFDGSQSHPAATLPIMDVGLSNCLGQNFLKHCGLYAKAVQGLSVMGSTFGGNFNGIQTYGCVGTLSANKCGNYVAPPLGSATGGNTAYGMLLEKSQMAIASDNLLLGNGIGSIIILP